MLVRNRRKIWNNSKKSINEITRIISLSVGILIQLEELGWLSESLDITDRETFFNNSLKMNNYHNTKQIDL